MIICGSGPSIDLVDPAEGDVFALGGAHDYLISRGIVPVGWINADPLPWVAQYIQNPHPDVTYLLASHSHRFLFEALEGHRVVLWHNNCGAGTERVVAETRNHMTGAVRLMVSGGPTGATRAPFLGDALGYRRFVLCGIDGDGGAKAQKLRTQEPMTVTLDGREFRVPRGFVQQAMAFETMVREFPEWQFEVKGDSFTAAVFRAARASAGQRRGECEAGTT